MGGRAELSEVCSPSQARSRRNPHGLKLKFPRRTSIFPWSPLCKQESGAVTPSPRALLRLIWMPWRRSSNGTVAARLCRVNGEERIDISRLSCHRVLGLRADLLSRNRDIRQRCCRAMLRPVVERYVQSSLVGRVRVSRRSARKPFLLRNSSWII